MESSEFIDKLSAAPADEPPVVLHADAHCIVLDKPAGLLCVPGRGPDKQDCLSARVQALYPDALVVHRLDMATSGLWLMARGIAAQRALSRAFADRTVDKRYEAVVAGLLQGDPHSWSRIELPIALDWPNRPRRIIDAVAGKASASGWRVLAHDAAAGTTRVELTPKTGRSHQLRVHLQAIGHPILGDVLYAPPHVAAAAPRLLLHATALRLAHPDGSGAVLALRSSPPF